MERVIISVIFSFISTNIDDIFVLMLLFSQVNHKLKNRHVIIGQYLGIGVLITVSIIGAWGVSWFQQKYIGLLGFVPIYLGIKSYLDYKVEKGNSRNSANEVNVIESSDFSVEDRLHSNKWIMLIKGGINQSVLKVAGITIANGGDNVGIYIPLLAGMNILGLAITISIFILFTALWCFIGYRLVEYPFIHKYIDKYKHILIPIVFIVIGLFIIVGNGTFSIILD